MKTGKGEGYDNTLKLEKTMCDSPGEAELWMQEVNNEKCFDGHSALICQKDDSTQRGTTFGHNRIFS